jgi:hypothetical protein
MRAFAAFMIVPILTHFAISLAGYPTEAMRTTLWVCFGLAVGGTLVGVLLYVLGGTAPPAPSLEKFLDGAEPGWKSPALFAAVRRGAAGARVPDRDLPAKEMP